MGEIRQAGPCVPTQTTLGSRRVRREGRRRALRRRQWGQGLVGEVKWVTFNAV